MNRSVRFLGTLLLVAAMSACGGSAPGPTPGPSRSVTIKWNPNRETGVNMAGGGYKVNISGQAPITVPYASGSTAPTSTSLPLPPGTYTVTVVAYAALDDLGGSAGKESKASIPYTLTVP
jgi:hypothetical protein